MSIGKAPNPARAATLGEFAPVLEQLHALTSQSYDTLLLANGPPQPDYRLLELCDDALHAWKQREAAWKRIRASRHKQPLGGGKHPLEQAMYDEAAAWQNKATRNTREASKLKATTPAGIYAKALLVKFSSGTATILAMSLAEDFVECPGLRASIWPADKPA